MTTPASHGRRGLHATSRIGGPVGVRDPLEPAAFPVVQVEPSGALGSRTVPPGVIEVLWDGAALTVRVSGDIDLLLSGALRDALHAVREHDGQVDVDLRSVSFFSVEAADVLGAMFRAHPPGVVALVGISRPVERTLRACGIPLYALPWRDGGT